MRKILFVLGMMVSVVVSGQWSELGGVNSLSTIGKGPINNIKSDNFGNIYVAGSLVNSNGNMCVAKFDGITWSELGGIGSLSSIIYPISNIKALCVDKAGNIYLITGYVNGSGISYVMKFDGNNWTILGGNNNLFLNGEIRTICCDTLNNVYVAGDFKNINGNRFVAKYDGVSWNELGGFNSFAANDRIESLYCDLNNNIYIGGWFTNVNGKQFVAKYDGVSWSELGGLNSLASNFYIWSICGDKVGKIYATVAKPSYQYNVAVYNGSMWSNLGVSTTFFGSSNIWSICSNNNGDIFSAGRFRNSMSNYYVAKFGTSWSELGGLNTLAANDQIMSVHCDISGNIYAAGYFTNSTGNYYVSKYTEPLPLTLTSFNTTLQQNNVLLNWHTANEVNVSHFNIQRSSNGKDFENIGKVNAGNKEYSFIDELKTKDQLPKTIYYKLEIVDKDGSKTYSTIQQITIKPQTPNIVIYPNPAKDMVTIECAGAKELLIIDYLGRTITQFNNVTQSQTLNTKQLTKGVYVVKAIMSNGEVKTEKLVVE